MDINNPVILTTTDPILGTVDSGFETHFFRINVIAGKFYQINLGGTDSILAAAYDTNGENKIDLNLSNINFIARETTSYLIEVATEGQVYDLSMHESEEISTNTPITETIGSSSDKDLFKIELTEGSRYEIKLAGEGSILSALYDENGLKVGDLNISEWTGNSPVTGTYYLEVAAQEGYVDVIDYTLSITEPEDDYNADNETQGLLGSTPVPGVIGHLEDKDWFKINLTEGASYNISLLDSSLAKFSAIYDAEGNFIAELPNKEIVYDDSTVTGTYYIEVSADEQQAGDYSIVMTEDLNLKGLDYHEVNRKDAADLNTDSAQSGVIEAKGGQDWFKIIVEPGKTYSITLTSDAIDPIINGIYDADGNFMQGSTNDDGADGFNAQLIATFDANEYFLAVGAIKEGTGAYQLTIAETTAPSQLDIQAGSSREKITLDDVELLATGEFKVGEISDIGETDKFQVELLADKEYQITLTSDTLADPYLSGIYDGKGTVIEHTIAHGGEGNNTVITFTPTQSALYYIEASSWDAAKTGTYTILVTETNSVEPSPTDDTGIIDVPLPVGDDFSNDINTTGTVTVGEAAVNGNIFEGDTVDRDWFKVTLEADTSYKIDLKADATNDKGLSSPTVYGIYDSTGATVVPARELTFTVDNAGDYYIDIGGSEVFYNKTYGDYSLSIVEDIIVLSEPPEDDTPIVINPNAVDILDNTQTTAVFTVGNPIQGGDIEVSGDKDWFKIFLEAGTDYQIDLQGARSQKGTLIDPYLYGIYEDGNTTPINNTSNDNIETGFDSQVIFTPTESKNYYISAGGAEENTGTYELLVTEWQHLLRDGDDYRDNIWETRDIEPGETIDARFDVSGDKDWIPAELTAGQTYKIYLGGGVKNDGYTLYNPFLTGIYDSDGQFINGTSNDNSGDNFDDLIDFTPTETGTYYIATESKDNKYRGSYFLSLLEDDYRSDTDSNGNVTLGSSKSGELETNYDRDWLKVTLQRGVSYQIDVEGSATGKGTLTDPLLRAIYDDQGSIVNGTFFAATNKGEGLNDRLEFTPNAGGDYYIDVFAVELIGTYTVHVDTI